MFFVDNIHIFASLVNLLANITTCYMNKKKMLESIQTIMPLSRTNSIIFEECIPNKISLDPLSMKSHDLESSLAASESPTTSPPTSISPIIVKNPTKPPPYSKNRSIFDRLLPRANQQRANLYRKVLTSSLRRTSGGRRFLQSATAGKTAALPSYTGQHPMQ